MARRRHLNNAPIQEALIDIQFVPGAGASELTAVAERLAERFSADPGDSQIGSVWESMFELQARPDSAPTAIRTSDVQGRRVDFHSKGQVLQLRPQGFTFSRLPKYVDWEEASSAALEMWSVFAGQVKAARINRVAVRYLNALQLPMPVQNIAEYLPVTPNIPAALPQVVANFLHRLILPRGNLHGQVTQAAQGVTENRSHLKVLVDIEVTSACDLETKDQQSLIDLLGQLRDYKNDLFFEFLSETTVGMYE